MFELWVVIAGCGRGEVLLVDVRAKEDLPPQLRRRVRRVGRGRFATEAEATRVRREYQTTQAPTVEAGPASPEGASSLGGGRTAPCSTRYRPAEGVPG
jgi:hypothetical protein